MQHSFQTTLAQTQCSFPVPGRKKKKAEGDLKTFLNYPCPRWGEPCSSEYSKSGFEVYWVTILYGSQCHHSTLEITQCVVVPFWCDHIRLKTGHETMTVTLYYPLYHTNTVMCKIGAFLYSTASLFPCMKTLASLRGCTYASAFLKSNSEQDTDPLIWFCLDKSTHQMKSGTFITKPSDIMYPNTTNPSYLPWNQDSVKLKTKGVCLPFYVFFFSPWICLLSVWTKHFNTP